MYLVFLNESGSPVLNSSGNFWSVSAVAVPETKLQVLSARTRGVHRSFLRDGCVPGLTAFDANDHLCPRNATEPWHLAYAKAMTKMAAGLRVKLFNLVVDKRTAERADHDWLIDLGYEYLTRVINIMLTEEATPGILVVPEGRPKIDRPLLAAQEKATPTKQLIVASPMMQRPAESPGLQLADMTATISRRYHETTYPKLFDKQILEGYDAVINSHYQGFVKPNTWIGRVADARGFTAKGYIYLWRRRDETEVGEKRSFRPTAKAFAP